MSSIETFLPYVRPFAPGVSDPAAYRHIRNSAIEFCERTRLWKWEDSYEIAASDCENILTPSGSILHDIEVVLFNGKEIQAIGTRDLDRKMPHWRTEDDGGLPQYVTQIEQNTIRVVPKLDGDIYLCLRLKPSQDTMDIPDFIASEFSECIGWGALGRLLMIPGHSFSNPDMANYYMIRFNEKVDRLITKSSKGQQNASKRTRASFF